MNKFHSLLPVAALAWAIIAAPVAAHPLQSGTPSGKPVTSEAKKVEGKAEKAESKQESAQESGMDRKLEGVSRAHREVLEPVAMEQARYMKRCAQLVRIQEIASEKSNEQMSAQAAELTAKNEEVHAARLAELRTKHGSANVDAALAWIDKRSGERENPGIIKAAKDKNSDVGQKVGDKERNKAKNKQEKTDELKEKAKEKAKDKPKENK